MNARKTNSPTQPVTRKETSDGSMPSTLKRSGSPAASRAQERGETNLASRARFNQVSAEFLLVDVETGLTFSGIALRTKDPDKKLRNRHTARKAYDTVLRLVEKVYLDQDQAQSLNANLKRLRSELVTLGEIF